MVFLNVIELKNSSELAFDAYRNQDPNTGNRTRELRDECRNSSMDEKILRKYVVGDFTVRRLVRSVAFIYACLLAFTLV